MGYDDVLPLLGNFGRYQKRVYFLVCLPSIVCALHMLANVFLGAKANHRCRLNNEPPNASYALPPDILNVSFPFEQATAQYSSCTILQGHRAVACDSYVYDHQTYKSTTTTEWDLVCDRSYLRVLSDSLFMVGVMVGSLVLGNFSDRYGRKRVFLVSIVAQVMFGIVAAFAPEYWTYTISRAALGGFNIGAFLIAYVLATEMFGPDYRLCAGLICQSFFSCGYILLTAFAYFIREWRHLQIAITVPGILFFSYWWLIPESIRWLLSTNKLEEAVEILRKAAQTNNVVVSDERLRQLLADDLLPRESDERRATVLDIFRHSNLRRKSLVIFYNWFSTSMIYYGLSWNTSNLGGNDYVNFVLGGTVEIPAVALLLLVVNRWGRRPVMCGSLAMTGIVLLLTAAVPGGEEWRWLLITLAMLGKFSIASSFGTIYIFSAEQFPTVIRNAGLGAASLSARVGGMLSPIINSSSETWKPCPLVIFGIFSLIGGCLTLILPETLNHQLPQTIADGEQFGKSKKTVLEQKEQFHYITKY